MKKGSALADWTPEQIALGKKWVETWKLAAEDLERIKRKEIRELDTELQDWFKKAAGRD